MNSGSYIILIENKKRTRIKVGSLGNIIFHRGFYVYVGSAMRGLQARMERHMGKTKKTFWHIDYLLKNRNTAIRSVYYKPSKKKEECEIAEKISQYGTPVPGFGCSDCSCESHLFRLRDLRFLDRLISSRVWFKKTD